jgi:hypothetical protein
MRPALRRVTWPVARAIAFCDAEGLDYGQPMQARAALPGGDLVHWT